MKINHKPHLNNPHPGTLPDDPGIYDPDILSRDQVVAQELTVQCARAVLGDIDVLKVRAPVELTVSDIIYHFTQMESKALQKLSAHQIALSKQCVKRSRHDQ